MQTQQHAGNSSPGLTPLFDSDVQAVQLMGRGIVYSYTVVTQPPEGYEADAPYVLALVKLDEGPMITAQLTDVGDISIGDEVKMVTRRLTTEGSKGVIVYGYKFRPTM